MPKDEAAKIDALVEKLRDYLHEHPQAADTVSGIATWWFAESGGEEHVQQAVDRLVESGEMRKVVSGARIALYGRAEG